MEESSPGLLLVIKYNLQVKTHKHALNINAAAQALTNLSKSDTNTHPIFLDMG